MDIESAVPLARLVIAGVAVILYRITRKKQKREKVDYGWMPEDEKDDRGGFPFGTRDEAENHAKNELGDRHV